MNNTKILQVIDQLHIGGAEKVFVDLCNILKENNVTVSALFLLQGGTLSRNLKSDIPVYELYRTSKWNVSSWYECSKIIVQFDIVHCHFRHVYRYISLVKKLFRLDCKVVLHDHYGSIDLDKSVPFLLDTFLKPKYYIGVSSTLVMWANKYLKINSERTFLLENIIIKKEVAKKDSLKKFDLVLVSNIKPVKNNVFAIKVAQYCHLSLLVIGQNQDNEYYKDLVKTAKDASEEVLILENVSDAQEVMSSAQIGLHASKSETGPLVLIEYLAQGLPFLAYETGEVAKILKPYFPDYFMDTFEVEQWAIRIQKLKNQTVDMDLMEQVFSDHFSSISYFKKINAIYVWILKN